MKKTLAKVMATFSAAVLLLSTVPIAYAETATVESVTEQLQNIDTLQQMQDNRNNYTTNGHYDWQNILDSTGQATYEKHQAKREPYNTYLSTMFAARLAAKEAYGSLSAGEQAQIDSALVEKLDDQLDTVFKPSTIPVTPADDAYIFEAPNVVGQAYEVSHYMVGINSQNRQIPQTFILVDTSDGATSWTPNGKYQPGESNYDLAYCCDIETGLAEGTDYRRINLEDSDYFTDGVAEKIRAIVENSYPFISMEEMKANLKKGGLKAEFVDSLGRSELIAATQMAIWQYSNNHLFQDGGKYFATINVTKNEISASNPRGYFTVMHDHTNEVWEWLPKGAQRSYDYKAAYRVNNLINYLCNLEGKKATEDSIVISDIKVGRVDLLPRGEDLYNVGLHITLNDGASAGDDVKLKIVSYSEDENGNKTQTAATSVKMGKSNEYTMTINAKYGDTIEVSAEGTQQLDKGVYFYEPKGGHTVSQALVGVSEGENPLYAAETFSFGRDVEGGLRIYKKSSEDKTPISDITFNVYDVTDAGVDPKATPTEEELAKYAVADKLVGSVVTDATGYAALELAHGTYLVVEQHNAEKVLEPAAPFYVVLPCPVEKEIEGENGVETVIEYTDVVSVYPKNTPVVPPPPPPPPPPGDLVGQFTLYKNDNADEARLLSGAQFQIYRAATEADTETETLMVDSLNCLVTPVKAEGENLVLTTGGDGSVTSPELPCGVYYIKEIKPPSGYVLTEKVFTVTVESKELETVNTCYIGNDRGIWLPETGGVGTTGYFAVGGALILLAVAIFIFKKRKA